MKDSQLKLIHWTNLGCLRRFLLSNFLDASIPRKRVQNNLFAIMKNGCNDLTRKTNAILSKFKNYFDYSFIERKCSADYFCEQ